MFNQTSLGNKQWHSTITTPEYISSQNGRKAWGFPGFLSRLQKSNNIRRYFSSVQFSSFQLLKPSHPLSIPSPPAPNPSQHQSLFQWVNCSHEVAKVLEFQLQHHSLQRNSRPDLLQSGLVGSPCSPRDIYLSFSDLTSLCIIGSRFIHLIRTDSNTFLFMAE